MFTVNRETLARELAVLQSASERKTTIPVLATVLVELTDGILKLTGTDLDVRASSEMKADGDNASFCVSSKDLFAIASLLETKELVITEDDSRIQITGGKSKHFLASYPAKDFPIGDEKKEAKTFSLSTETLLAALTRTAFAASREEGKYSMQGVHLVIKDRKFTAVAVQGAFMAVAEYPVDQDVEIEVTIPSRGVAAFLGLLSKTDSSETTVSVYQNGVQITAGRQAFSSRLLDGKFPNWEMVLPKTLNHSIQLNPELVTAAMKRAAITSGEFALVKKPLKIVLSKSEMMIESRDSVAGCGYEPIAIDCESLNGDTVKIGINAQNFLDFFNQARGQSVTLQIKDPGSQFLLTINDDPTYRFIAMPVTLRNW